MAVSFLSQFFHQIDQSHSMGEMHKLLFKRDWNKQRILDIYAVLDWMMRLPPEPIKENLAKYREI